MMFMLMGMSMFSLGRMTMFTHKLVLFVYVAKLAYISCTWCAESSSQLNGKVINLLDDLLIVFLQRELAYLFSRRRGKKTKDNPND